MNNQVIVPIAVIILLAIIFEISFLNKKDRKDLEDQLKRDISKKRLSDVDEGEKQSV